MPRHKRTTPWLARRGDPNHGTFYAYWYDAEKRETKRFTMSTTDSHEAELRFAEFLVNGREIRAPRSGGLTVATALDDYLEEHVLKKCAAANRQQEIARHLKEFFGDRPLADVDVQSSRAYAAARYTGEIGGGARRKVKVGSPSTVRRELTVLVAAANHAIWMKRATAGIQVDLPAETKLGPDDEAPYYTRDELDNIFLAAEMTGGELELFVRLLYWTGARRASIQNLTRSQVKMKERRLLLQTPGKRATKKRQPIVPVLKTMVADLEALLMLSDERRERLFHCPDFYRPYKSLVRGAGIEEARAHPHIMRHTRATHLLQDGKSIYDVARLLGDTINTVERVYGHHSWDQLGAKLED